MQKDFEVFFNTIVPLTYGMECVRNTFMTCVHRQKDVEPMKDGSICRYLIKDRDPTLPLDAVLTESLKKITGLKNPNITDDELETFSNIIDFVLEKRQNGHIHNAENLTYPLSAHAKKFTNQLNSLQSLITNINKRSEPALQDEYVRQVGLSLKRINISLESIVLAPKNDSLIDTYVEFISNDDDISTLGSMVDRVEGTRKNDSLQRQ